MKFVIDQDGFDALPAALQAYYKKRDDGKYVLQVEGAVAREKLDEFRDNNTQLKKQLKDLQDLWDGLEADDVRELVKKRADIESGRTKDGKTVEQIVAERVEAMKKDHEKEVGTLKTSLSTTTDRLRNLVISDAAVSAATKLGLRATAADDLKARAQNVFRLNEDGTVVAMSGDKPIYGKTGDPLSMDDWAAELVEKAPHLFEASGGTGAGSSSGAGGNPTNGRNPWKTDQWNLTQQGEIQKRDPAMAARMRAAAGAK